ncbi:MAG: hypothetical protein WBG63_18615 [Phormidesmis sp.]
MNYQPNQLDLDAIPLEGFTITRNDTAINPTHLSSAAFTACNTN